VSIPVRSLDGISSEPVGHGRFPSLSDSETLLTGGLAQGIATTTLLLGVSGTR